MPLKLALGVRGIVAGHRLGGLEGGGGGGTGLRERGNDTSKSTGRSGRQNAATQRNMRREERVTVRGGVKKQRPDGMSHGGYLPPPSDASLPGRKYTGEPIAFQALSAPVPGRLHRTSRLIRTSASAPDADGEADGEKRAGPPSRFRRADVASRHVACGASHCSRRECRRLASFGSEGAAPKFPDAPP